MNAAGTRTLRQRVRLFGTDAVRAYAAAAVLRNKGEPLHDCAACGADLTATHRAWVCERCIPAYAALPRSLAATVSVLLATADSIDREDAG